MDSYWFRLQLAQRKILSNMVYSDVWSCYKTGLRAAKSSLGLGLKVAVLILKLWSWSWSYGLYLEAMVLVLKPWSWSWSYGLGLEAVVLFLKLWSCSWSCGLVVDFGLILMSLALFASLIAYDKTVMFLTVVQKISDHFLFTTQFCINCEFSRLIVYSFSNFTR